MDIQNRVKEFVEDKNLKSSVNIRIMDLTSEIGELNKEFLKITDYGKKDFTVNDDFKKEFGDTLFSLICLANESKIDLNECLELVLRKYEKRFRKGGIGSENE